MADIVSPAVRSRMMAGIGNANTKPEMIIRRGLHALGWRYRLHAKGLPGRPDLVFPSRRAVIFVQGCFWHGHDCVLFRWPATRAEFWRTKISGNITRDHRVRGELLELGWRVVDVWECTLKGRNRRPVDEVITGCAAFLEGKEVRASIGTVQTVTIEHSA
ncbi:MAG: very short patch repair endonuclease [Novosphingobium sp.]